MTGANFLLEIADKHVLVDCGFAQGSHEAKEENKKPFEYDPASIDILFVTHAHIDHIGRIPKLVKDGFKGKIFSTPETRSLAELMLADAAKINMYDESPIYTAADVSKSLSLWEEISYHRPREFESFTLEFLDAGHILGSAMLKFSVGGRNMLFTGDLGNSPSPLLRDTERVADIDYMVMESVYGDRNHEGREEREELFKKVVLESIAREGTLLIPAFSLERTQVILSLFDNLIESKAVPSVPVFLDSPLAIKVTDVYERVTRHYNEGVQEELSAGDEIFNFPKLKETAQVRDSREIQKVQGPKIIVAGSGMSTGGRILGHEAHYLPDPSTTILLMGYQAPGTLGRQLYEGMKEVVIDESKVKVRAKVEKISGYSAHADSDMLVNFVSASKDSLKKVFTAMGEPSASIFLAQRLRDELGVEALMPERGKTYRLEL